MLPKICKLFSIISKSHFSWGLRYGNLTFSTTEKGAVSFLVSYLPIKDEFIPELEYKTYN